jgi:hypothetical protein
MVTIVMGSDVDGDDTRACVLEDANVQKGSQGDKQER